LLGHVTIYTTNSIESLNYQLRNGRPAGTSGPGDLGGVAGGAA
jgi:hypothetical protein